MIAISRLNEVFLTFIYISVGELFLAITALILDIIVIILELFHLHLNVRTTQLLLLLLYLMLLLSFSLEFIDSLVDLLLSLLLWQFLHLKLAQRNLKITLALHLATNKALVERSIICLCVLSTKLYLLIDCVNKGSHNCLKVL